MWIFGASHSLVGGKKDHKGSTKSSLSALCCRCARAPAAGKKKRKSALDNFVYASSSNKHT